MPKTPPIDLDRSGNGSRIRTLEYDEADAFMLAHAMMIAAGSAMMSKGRTAMGRLDHYRAQFLAHAPAAAKLMDNDHDLCEIAIAMSAATSWTIHRVREHEWSRTFRTVVTVGDRHWCSDSIVEEPAFVAIREMVEQVAPMSCIQAEREDVVGSPWAVGW